MYKYTVCILHTILILNCLLTVAYSLCGIHYNTVEGNVKLGTQYPCSLAMSTDCDHGCPIWCPYSWAVCQKMTPLVTVHRLWTRATFWTRVTSWSCDELTGSLIAVLWNTVTNSSSLNIKLSKRSELTKNSLSVCHELTIMGLFDYRIRIRIHNESEPKVNPTHTRRAPKPFYLQVNLNRDSLWMLIRIR